MIRKRMLIEVDEKTGKTENIDFKVTTDAEKDVLPKARNLLMITEARILGSDIADNNTTIEGFESDLVKVFEAIKETGAKAIERKLSKQGGINKSQD